jgi:hypothetical protein
MQKHIGLETMNLVCPQDLDKAARLPICVVNHVKDVHRCPSLTREALEALYHLPIDQASRFLGIGITALKKNCRKFGIPRWPHRKLKSMEKLLQDIIMIIPEEKAHKVKPSKSWCAS